ncbi:MAG: ComEC/Rec2 family competence protein [Gloeomargarita sp. SKYB31]|nr:ComEC/Rec2 family competence protein [Gloeomargarita sp. SKYB31]
MVLVWVAAWVLGLLAAQVPYGMYVMPLVGVGLAGAAWRFPRWRRQGLVAWVWVVAGLIGLLAGFYLQWRTPQPGPKDISTKAPQFDVVVTGKALNVPRLNASGKRRFFLAVEWIEMGEAPYTRMERVTGNLYVTVAPDQAEGVTPGRKVSVKGDLYLPVTAAFRGGFDFKNYLAQYHTFAGIRGEKVTVDTQSGQGWGLWQIRQRITDVHRQALGNEGGPLVSAMVLGARVVDLDTNLRAAFTRAGLAHTIAASGFHVSLLLGAVLALTYHLGWRVQLAAGLVALVVFVMLAGFEAGVARASLMGAVGLWGLVQTGQGDVTGKRQPLPLLLIVAAVLLLYNPNWITNLGFQFSFLATLGLMLWATPIAQRLTILPPALAELIAVPTAAYLWTLPLQLHTFGLINTYAILLNAVAAPLVMVLTLGGMVTAVIGLAQFQLGVWAASLLQYPLDLLLAIVNWTNQLPWNSIAAGRITVGQLLLLYGLLGLLCTGWLWQKRRWLWAVLFGIASVWLPLLVSHATRLQFTALDAGRIPVMVVQARGRVAVINAGDERTVRFTLLPFLQLQGVNRIDVGVAWPGVPNQGWTDLQRAIPVRALYGEGGNALTDLQAVTVGPVTFHLTNTEPPLLRLTAGRESLVWLPASTLAQQDAWVRQGVPPAQVLWWGGGTLGNRLLQSLQPYAAIASNFRVRRGDMERLERLQIRTFVTGQAGAVQWQPGQGFSGGRQESAG